MGSQVWTTHLGVRENIMGLISTLRRFRLSDRYSQQVEDLIVQRPVTHLA